MFCLVNLRNTRVSPHFTLFKKEMKNKNIEKTKWDKRQARDHVAC